jgi:hypothetical protein
MPEHVQAVSNCEFLKSYHSMANEIQSCLAAVAEAAPAPVVVVVVVVVVVLVVVEVVVW